MSDNRHYASQLDEVDIGFLAERYGFSVDFIRGLNDTDWLDLLGCGEDELPFYLFDEEDFDEYLADLNEGDDFYDEDNPVQGLFDLNYVLERQLNEPAIASAPAPKGVSKVSQMRPTPRPSQYSSPSRFSRKTVASKITHHFELVQ